MNLADYLTREGIALKQFAGQIGVSAEAVRLYVERKRMPRPGVMAKIVEATNGAVTANDLYAQGEAAQ